MPAVTVKPKRFFRACLLLPLVVPIAVGPAGPTSWATLLWAAAAVGGLPYIAFAVVLFLVLGRLRSLRGSQVLSVCAPLLFLPFFGGYLALVALASSEPLDAVVEAWGLTVELAGLVLRVGYVYVALANAVALVLAWSGVLARSNAGAGEKAP